MLQRTEAVRRLAPLGLISGAVLHLVLVSFGAAGKIPVSEATALGRAIGAYRAYTGADNAYGFFAPGVASERRVVLHVYSGDHWQSIDERFQGRESNLRLSTVVGMLTDPNLREPLAASWAARAFGSFPGARLVLVEIKVYLVPSMRELRAGSRPRWRTEGFFSFARSTSPVGSAGRS